MSEQQTRSAWDRFWFGEVGTGLTLRPLRIGMAVMAIAYFASHWADVGRWFSGTGVLGSEALGQFLLEAQLGEAVRWRLSPLYWIESTWILRGYLVVGMLLAAAWPWVRITRAVGVALWLMVVGMANRAFMISGLEELVLVWGIAYLAIAPPDGSEHWTGSLALRLIQVHLTLWLVVTGLTMLSAEAWWEGTGAMALVAPAEDRRFDLVDSFSGTILLEGTTHAVVLVALVAPVLLWLPAVRALGFGLATFWSLGLALLTSQFTLFVGLAVLLWAFRPRGGSTSA